MIKETVKDAVEEQMGDVNIDKVTDTNVEGGNMPGGGGFYGGGGSGGNAPKILPMANPFPNPATGDGSGDGSGDGTGDGIGSEGGENEESGTGLDA